MKDMKKTLDNERFFCKKDIASNSKLCVRYSILKINYYNRKYLFN